MFRIQDRQIVQAGVEVGQRMPGRDEYGNTGVTGEKRFDLGTIESVVKHNEDAPALLRVTGKYRPVQASTVLELSWHIFVGDGQRLQQGSKRSPGAEPPLRGVSEEVDEQHAAGEPAVLVQNPIRYVQNEFGFAHSGQSGDNVKRWRILRGAGAQRCGEGVQYRVASGEGTGWGRHSGESRCYLPRKLQGYVTSLNNDVEEDATTDLVVDARIVCAGVSQMSTRPLTRGGISQLVTVARSYRSQAVAFFRCGRKRPNIAFAWSSARTDCTLGQSPRAWCQVVQAAFRWPGSNCRSTSRSRRCTRVR